MDFKTFLQLPFRKKLEHIWEYYRWQILVTVVVVSFLGSWIFSAVTHKDPVLELEMINAYEQTPDGEAFQEFLEQNGIEYYEDAVVLNKHIRFSPVDLTPDIGSTQMIQCAVASGEADLFFWDSREMLPPLNNGSLMDLRWILPEETLREYEDLLVFGEDPDTGEQMPCGIFLERNPWIMEQMYYVDCTVGVAITAKDPQLAVALIQYLLDAQG